MTEKLIGQAKREMIGNDIFWDFHMYDFKMPHLFIDPTCEYVPIGDERFGCSECGYTVELDFDVPVTDETPMPFKHCPNCGSRVVRPNGD